MTFALILKFIAKWWKLALAVVIVIMLIGGALYLRSWRLQVLEDAARKAVVESIVEGIESGAREDELEKKVEKLVLEHGGTQEDVAEAKDALEMAKTLPEGTVTAQDILDLLGGDSD